MAETDTPKALLDVCIQDLHAGETLIVDRLPAVARHASDGELTEQLDGVIAGARDAAAMLADSGISVDGPENLWMTGILDDAARDTTSIKPGLLLDIAMIGAVRKALAASIVSYETAIALAETLDPDLRVKLADIRDGAAAADDALRDLLQTLTAAV